MQLRPEEPEAGPWHAVPLTDLVHGLLVLPPPAGRPAVLAIDGRSSSGKTTLAGRIGQLLPRAAVVHTDDIAWHHSRFGWPDLLIAGVLGPAQDGQLVTYRPPAWDVRARPGAIHVPAGTGLLVVEGVGASRRELAYLVDATIWVQADTEQTERRTRARIQSGETTATGVTGWMAEEYPFLERDRLWDRAGAIVNGTPGVPHDPGTEVVAALPHG